MATIILDEAEFNALIASRVQAIVDSGALDAVLARAASRQFVRDNLDSYKRAYLRGEGADPKSPLVEVRAAAKARADAIKSCAEVGIDLAAVCSG